MIRNLLFDIGRVLLSFDLEATVEELGCYSERYGPRDFKFEHVFLTGEWEKMETGEMAPEEYFELFREVSGCRISYRHFCLIWRKHFYEIEPMTALGGSLARDYKIYFFSNTDPIHVPRLFDRYPACLFFDGLVLSWELGLRKPDPRFFEQGLARFGLGREECLFIDDKPENVESARTLGIRSIHYLDPVQAERDIRRELEPAGGPRLTTPTGR
ncbi:MAG: HAD family phosphatase [Candidatus Glassbacteria bacterium]